MAIPLNTDKLTDAEMNQALEAVNLIKEKRNGIIKGRTCANGSKKKILERGRKRGITNGIAKGFVHHSCDGCI